jgi:transketolase
MTDNNHLVKRAKEIRNLVLDMIFGAKSSHLGCALSIVDILTGLYFGDILNVDPKNPDWENRDRFILSKGHACVALYATLALRGYFPVEKLTEYGTDGTLIGDHNTRGALPGIETTNGSLGHGLPLGIGMALAAKKTRRSSRVFVLVGDGELQEGSNWEALMFAGFHKLDNLVLIIDNNNLETLGPTNQILSLSTLHKKLESFGWDAENISGHIFADIIGQLNISHEKPFALNCHTTKGKGVPFMHNDHIWHGKCPTQEEYKRAKMELNGEAQ